MRHATFIARTVLVHNNDVEAACRILNRILGKEDILDQFRRTRYYEKPFQVIKRNNQGLLLIFGVFSFGDASTLKDAKPFITKIWIERYSSF